MEEEKLLIHSSNFGMEVQSNSMDQSDPFESGLSSIVSSPAASNGPTADCFMIRELIGRLGNIYNSPEISSQSYIQAHNNNNSTTTSCYNTPLNSPPKITSNLPNTFAADPGFARIRLNETESGKLSSNQSVKVGGSQENNNGNKKFSRLPIPDHIADQVDSKEESSVSELISKPPSDHLNARKRKSIPRGKLIAETDESNTKKSKQDETENGKAEANKDNSKPSEPPKDYIHVRARRGQATDSHSLAERVRREKISERMKFLQDLVPGCNKVTGKAVMLDEIINYVQSLQRQVEFLSMKLATVNPRMDFNMEALLSKDMLQCRGSDRHTLYNYPMDFSAPTCPFGLEPQQGLPLHNYNNNNGENHFLMNPFHRNSSMQLPPVNGHGEAISQFASFWEDDLQSLVQMGFNRNQPPSFHGSMATAQMKIEF